MSNMDELENKAQKGLDKFKAEGGKMNFQSILDGKIDDMFGEPVEGSDDRNLTSTSSAKKAGNNKIIWGVIIAFGLAAIGYVGYKDGSASKTKMEIPSLDKKEPRVLFAQYFEPLDDINSSVERGALDEEAEKQSLGMMYYNKKNYKKAAATLMGSNDANSKFYGVVSLLASGNAKSAASIFDQMLTDSKFEKYHDLITWYHGLALMESDQLSKAKPVFQSIAEQGGYKSKEAKEILGQL